MKKLTEVLPLTDDFVNAITQLRDEAWYLATKYRFDPFLGRAHQEYLDKLNESLNKLESYDQQK